MKKTKTIFILLISLQLLLTSFAYAACPVDPNKPAETFNRLCKNVDDVICKNVPDRIRRSCDEKDQTIVHAGMTSHEVYDFAKGCMVSAAKSFADFFTVFLPELCKEIWKLTKEMYELASSSKERASVWSKIKGGFESARSLASDVYESVKKNPGQYFSELWSKITDAVGPLVADYDCLNPQTKVEKICGFVASWVVPPALLAKVIVKGAKGAKELLEMRKVAKAAKEAEKAPQVLAARLKLDTKNLKKQALQLQELREIDKKGHLKDPQKQLMLKALELRSPELSIINQELDQHVLALRKTFEAKSTSPAEKARVLEEIFLTEHPSRTEIIQEALKSESFEVRDQARLLGLRAGVPINWSAPGVLDDMVASAQKALLKTADRNNRQVILAEIKLLPEVAYMDVISKLTGEAKLEALRAVRGKSSSALEQLLKGASEEERVVIIENGAKFDMGIDKTTLLLEHYFHDPSQAIKNLCEKLLLERNNEALLAQIKKFPGPESEKLHQRLYEITLKNPLAHENVSNEKLLKNLEDAALMNQRGGNFAELQSVGLAFAKRDYNTVRTALENPDPMVRTVIFQNIAGRHDADFSTLILKATKDPVDQVRLSALSLMAVRDDAISRGLIQAMSQHDPSEAVRDLASKMVRNFGKGARSETERIEQERRTWSRTLSPEEKAVEYHAANFEGANNVYLLPEFESNLTAQELVAQKKAFLESVPTNFIVKETVTDAKSGFKLVSYFNKDDPNRIMISIAGTQTKMDALTDAAVGVPQLKSAAYLDSVEKTVKGMLENPYSKISIGGHSLGGAVAQAYAHDVAVGLKKAGVTDWDKRIEVVGWNGFGGVNPLKRTGRYDAEVAAKLNATNYYVPGDIVSRIGEHIGVIKELPKVDYEGGNKLYNLALSAHVRPTIESAIQKGELANAKTIKLYKPIILPTLSKSLGWMFTAYQDISFAKSRKEIVEKMLETRQLWAEQQGYRDIINESGWLDKELADMRKNAGSDAEWVNRAIDEANKKYEQTLKEKRAAPKL